MRDDTQQTIQHLKTFDVPFEYVDIDQDPEGMQVVRNASGGQEKTPVVVMEGEDTITLVEPTTHELDQALDLTGLRPTARNRNNLS